MTTRRGLFGLLAGFGAALPAIAMEANAYALPTVTVSEPQMAVGTMRVVSVASSGSADSCAHTHNFSGCGPSHAHSHYAGVAGTFRTSETQVWLGDHWATLK
jgi:hypothetical protein